MPQQPYQPVIVRVPPEQYGQALPVLAFINAYDYDKTFSRIDKVRNKLDRLKLLGAGLVRRAAERGDYELYFVTMHLLPGEKAKDAISNLVRSRRWPGLKISYVGVVVPEIDTPTCQRTAHVHLILIGFPRDVETQTKIADFMKDKHRRKANALHGQLVYDMEGLVGGGLRDGYLRLERNLKSKGATVIASQDVRAHARVIAVHGPKALKDLVAPMEEGLRQAQHGYACPKMQAEADAARFRAIMTQAPTKTGFFRLGRRHAGKNGNGNGIADDDDDFMIILSVNPTPPAAPSPPKRSFWEERGWVPSQQTEPSP